VPTSLEGQLSIARSEYAVARAALDKMTVRAPSDGTVLPVNVHGQMIRASTDSLKVLTPRYMQYNIHVVIDGLR
jgi:multidrug resistance efflux pump